VDRAPPTTSSSNFDRPNRLKSREDGNIRWVELLEKFRSVQERARRAQRQNNMDGDEIPPMGVSELRIGDGAVDVKGKETRGVGLQTIPQKEPAPAPPVPAKRIGLGRQFGRLGGAVAGKGRRNP
jgi:vacuole morphology and inheritance protein 14